MWPLEPMRHAIASLRPSRQEHPRHRDKHCKLSGTATTRIPGDLDYEEIWSGQYSRLLLPAV